MKIVVITGSTRGLGLAMARDFLKAGCNVVLSGRRANLAENLSKELQPFDGHYQYVRCDVRNESDLENLWQEATGKWGQVDIWINNAGQNGPHEYCFDTEACYINAIIDTNIRGMILGSRLAARNMLLQGSGQIWNMEGLGSNNMIQAKTILYGTSKHALTYFTRALAKELQLTPVKAGRLSPGMMLTDFITQGPDGQASPVINDRAFKFIFNTLADKPEAAAAYFVPRILNNKRNNAHLVWLTNLKTFWRFMKVPFTKRKLL